MHTQERKAYEAPNLNELGSLNQLTQGGDAANSDSTPFTANTAFGPEFAS